MSTGEMSRWGLALLAAGYDISKLTPYLRPGIGQRDLTPFRYDKDGLNRNGGRWRVEVAKELLQRCGKSAALEDEFCHRVG
jgi:hypothetical protein